MALIRCPECSSEVSDRATACPNCGYPVGDRTGPAMEKVRTALEAGSKIEAIKLYREATNLGLKESKDAVEQIENELRASGVLSPPPASSVSGFVIAVALFLLILAGLAAWLMKH